MPEHITSDGVRLAVAVDGPNGPGATADQATSVVLVHGLAGSIELAWRATGVIDRLAGAGLRTVAYDLRGHGRSDAPTEEGNYGDRRMVDDLIEVVTTFASAPLAALSERVPGSRTVTLPGDHFTAPATTEFADVIIEAAAAAN